MGRYKTLKNILIAVTGMSPQVVTETLFALVIQKNWVPDQILVMTTEHGKNRIVQDLLHPDTGQFYAFCAEYGLVDRIAFDESCVRVISDAQGVPLPDIRSPEENTLAANQILAFVSEVCSDDEVCVHASIAGGRKSMGFYLGYALSMYARVQDSASHVLVNAPFEGLQDFFFPPKSPVELVLKSTGAKVSTEFAEVMLADVPIVKMKAGLPLHHEGGSSLTYSEAVAIAQENIAPEVTLRLSKPRERRIWINQHEIKLPDAQFALLYWVARLRERGELLVPSDEGAFAMYVKMYASVTGESAKLDTIYKRSVTDQNFSQAFFEYKSKLHKHLSDRLNVLARLCQIVRVSGDGSAKSGYARYELNVAHVVFDSD